MRIAYNKVLYPAQTEPVTLQQAKTHLRVDHSDEDALITILIQTATEICEFNTNRSFVTQTRQIKLDHFPRYYGYGYQPNYCTGAIYITMGQLIAITGTDTATSPNTLGITYYDQDETLQTLDSGDYWVDNSSNIPRLVVKNSWPATFDMLNAVTITYTAGYGSASSVPAAIKQAILLIVGHLYENRETVSTIEMYKIPFGAETLLSQYVVEQSVVY